MLLKMKMVATGDQQCNTFFVPAKMHGDNDFRRHHQGGGDTSFKFHLKHFCFFFVSFHFWDTYYMSSSSLPQKVCMVLYMENNKFAAANFCAMKVVIEKEI